MSDRWRCEPLAPAHEEPLLRHLSRHSGGCFCRYWWFAGDKHQWQLALAEQGERQRAAFREDLHAGRLEGVVAMQGGEVWGWLSLAPRARLAKLYSTRPYAGLAPLQGPEPGGAVGCLLVAPEHRRRGVGHSLVAGAVARAVSLGWSFLDAFPRGADDEPDALVWTGPRRLFEAHGFSWLAGEHPYPVLRRLLRRPDP